MSTVVGNLSLSARERIRLVLSFLMFKAMRIFVLKLSKFRETKSLAFDVLDEIIGLY